MVPSSALSLATGLARRCALYPSPIALAPRVLVIDVPAANRGGGLALGHYCPIIVENPAEEAECEAFLRAPRADPMPPDLFDRRSSSGRSDEIVTEGIFEFCWRGETLYARNNAVGDSYLFAWSQLPEEATSEGVGRPREQALIWRANYHPDGGQLIYPLDGQDFVVPLALPGDDVTPDSFVASYCDGGQGLYIHPNVWHGAFMPIVDHCRFIDRQGRVHARVSVDSAKEFGGYLVVPLHFADWARKTDQIGSAR